MISVIIPTLNCEATLPACLSALIPAVVDGLVREVIIADGGSSDRTGQIAESSGADRVSAGPARSNQLIAGAEKARFPWLLFLPPDTIPGAGWEREVETHIAKVDAGERKTGAGVFAFEIDDSGLAPRVVETGTWLGQAIFGYACAEQGLLVSRALYAAAGGFQPLEALEDLDLTRRLGRRQLTRFRTPLLTAIEHYPKGYGTHSWHYGVSLALYGLKGPAGRIAALGSRRARSASL